MLFVLLPVAVLELDEPPSLFRVELRDGSVEKLAVALRPEPLAYGSCRIWEGPRRRLLPVRGRLLVRPRFLLLRSWGLRHLLSLLVLLFEVVVVVVIS